MILVQRELWQHVTGEATLPENSSLKEQKRFKNKENKTLATIALGVDPEHQIHILDCEKASDAWDALQKIFESKSRARILQLKKQMLTIKLKPNETMNSYLTRLKTCSDSLKEVGYEFKDEDLAYSMLAGLPDEYDGIVMSLANLDDEKFKSAEIKEVLMNEFERRILKETKPTEEQPKETYIQTKKKNCNNGLLVELNNTALNDSWLIDSGATHHVCKYRDWFDSYKPIVNETIYSTDS
ncbi:uncharacterized protein LOC118646102 [Monomorium pharaonis]|uniref:uncharacterized protein LOC118646099 n=1 Tax=Monomorium pharaonis TaxID=307658 RepID=UPI0017473C96|nr:uncharacterized protein LOC118646099 [Monomorium pharaonis]XP_036144289.1 uncharacterized protein LOC118646102 [Monomorium pharaonis]